MNHIFGFKSTIEKATNEMFTEVDKMKEYIVQKDIKQSMKFIQNCLHLQSTTMGCLGKALDDVLDTSMTLSLNLLLNRRDNFLKLCHRDVTDKDIAKLRNASLTRKELFNSKVLSEVEQNFIQWSQINREPVYKKHRSDNYGSCYSDSKKDSSQNRYQNAAFQNFCPQTKQNEQNKRQTGSYNSNRGSARLLGAEGSDYKEVSTKYPGSHLQGFLRVWENLNAHPRVVLVLKQGYCLPFKQKPPLIRFPSIKSSYTSQVKQEALLEAVQQMVQKRAVVPVQNKNSLGFYSCLFLVPKPENKWRSSNTSQCGKYFIACSHLQNGNHGSHSGFSSDRRMGSFYRPHRRLFPCTHTSKVSKYLHFHVQGQAYQFRALPFGIATAPLEFTRVVKEVKFIALSQGV